MITGAVDEAVTQLRRAADALLGVPVEGLDAAGFVPLLEAVEVERRRLEAVDQRLLAGAAHAGVASLFGQPGLAGALASLLRIDVPEARRRVARAGDLGPRRALTGEVLEPILPAAARAAAEGVLSGAQADVIIGCLERIPTSAPAAAWPVAEQVLVQAAKTEGPRSLGRTAVELLARLDPDGLEPAEEQAQRSRAGFRLKNSPPRPSLARRPRWSSRSAITPKRHHLGTMDRAIGGPLPVRPRLSPDTRLSARSPRRPDRCADPSR